MKTIIEARAQFSALGTTACVLVTKAAGLPAALAVLRGEVEAIDRSCSRFRSDSELSRLNAAAGHEVRVSALLASALAAAIRAARLTGGDVDPTVGGALRRAGYDRDFASVPKRGPAIETQTGLVAGWEVLEFDRQRQTVRVPPGVELDLGATAKALSADRAAQRASAAARCGVLVSLGGDLSVCGPAPDDGWLVQLADDHADHAGPSQEAVTIRDGGVATSGTAVRRWLAGDREAHHIIDPATGSPAAPVWKTVTVSAASCVDANTASTAAIVRGDRARAWLAALGLPARLVSCDGKVTHVGGWPFSPQQ